MGNRADSGANDAAQQTVSTLALTDEERTAYLKACGWEVDAASCTVREVIIPSDFDETYQSYADLQARQGFDLEKLKGKRVKQVVYSVTNSEESDVLAELLIYRGKIVAGDICSMKTDGGFTRGLMDRTGQKSNDTKDTSESTKQPSGFWCILTTAFFAKSTHCPKKQARNPACFYIFLKTLLCKCTKGDIMLLIIGRRR